MDKREKALILFVILFLYSLNLLLPLHLKTFPHSSRLGATLLKEGNKAPRCLLFRGHVDEMVYNTVKFQFFVLKKEQPPGPSHSSKLPAELLWLPFF